MATAWGEILYVVEAFYQIVSTILSYYNAHCKHFYYIYTANIFTTPQL